MRMRLNDKPAEGKQNANDLGWTIDRREVINLDIDVAECC